MVRADLVRLVVFSAGVTHLPSTSPVRDRKDRWIRVALEAGDMIILPAGIYHRFTLDEKNYIKALRLFVGEPVWTPHNRPQEDNPVRKAYVRDLPPLADGGDGVEESKAE